MATIKSDPIDMVEQGQVKVADKIVFYHKNSSSSLTGSVLVYGHSGEKQVPLLYSCDHPTTPDYSDGDTIAANTWVYIETIAAGTSAFGDQVAGELYYNNTGDTVTLETGDTASDISYVSLNASAEISTDITASVAKLTWAPCERIYYEVDDIENLKNLYMVVVATSSLVDIQEPS